MSEINTFPPECRQNLPEVYSTQNGCRLPWAACTFPGWIVLLKKDRYITW